MWGMNPQLSDLQSGADLMCNDFINVICIYAERCIDKNCNIRCPLPILLCGKERKAKNKLNQRKIA